MTNGFLPPGSLRSSKRMASRSSTAAVGTHGPVFATFEIYLPKRSRVGTV